MKEIISRFYTLPSGNICDANGRGGNMCQEIKPIGKEMKLVGPAFTVKCQPGDNLTLHKAINEAPEGAVLVIDAHSFTKAGAFGDVMATACMAKKIAGVVIDGACRDANDIEEMGFPAFCRALNPGGTVKESVGELNQVIQCGGVVVRPGDFIIGDRDGVVVVPFEKVEFVLTLAEEKNQKEIVIKLKLLEGASTLDLLDLRGKLI